VVDVRIPAAITCINRDDAVGVNADKGNDGRAPACDFGLEALAAGAKFVVGEFIRAGGGASTMLVMPNPRSKRRDPSKGKKNS
jgi:hypothetical protein